MGLPVAEGVFIETDNGPALLGSRCRQCGNHMFPTQDGCPRCTSTDTETVELARQGTLWTWTVQGFAPKAPPYAGDVDNFEPFGVGYVELPDQVKVEARLTEADPDKLEIGMEMELVTVPLRTDDDGNEVVTFAFAPATAPDTENGAN
ncbi:MAG: Zn-ribbon domain-containing OB-fold protein [Acidimicrobiia bacterium]|nr:Zn-ribbon domain-containing OB-fold protein [Acidimicrobiia bacterium]